MTHSLTGIFAFSLPLGVALWVLFQGVIKPGIFVMLPGPWQSALRPNAGAPQWGRARVWLGVALAVLLGAISHVGLDEFTHDYGFAANTWPTLFATPTFLAHQPLYKLLQYGLGMLGSLLCMGWVWRAYRRGPQIPWQTRDFRRLALIALGIIALCGLGTAYGLHYARILTGSLWFRVALVHSVAASLVSLGLGSILAGIMAYLLLSLRAKRPRTVAAEASVSALAIKASVDGR